MASPLLLQLLCFTTLLAFAQLDRVEDGLEVVEMDTDDIDIKEMLPACGHWQRTFPPCGQWRKMLQV
jgi:hypothetical protein